jgi:hypothetical protein
MDKLISDLSLYGNVQSIKNDYVFSLLITKKPIGYSLTMQQIPLKIIELCLNFLEGQKPTIEVFKNEQDFLILILKP